MKTRAKILVMILAASVMTSPTIGKVIFVDTDATGANDGSSWMNAFNYLQDALAAVQSGDEIRVAEGIYKPDQGSGVVSGDREATFQLVNSVTLQGGYAGFGEPYPDSRDINAYETILSGDLEGNDRKIADPCDLENDPCRAENSYQVVRTSGTDETAVLDCFTIKGGAEGGMCNSLSSSTVTDCMFSGNSANQGGGMHNSYSNPILTNCMFSGNLARHGGGMFNWGSRPTLNNCTFRGNSGIIGGGMENAISTPKLTNCIFRGNSANSGGGMFNFNSSPTLNNCTFIVNTAEDSGGGIANHASSRPTLTNCAFSGNTADKIGGGMLSAVHCSTMLSNCTFAANLALNGNSLATDYPGQPSSLQLTNCILWDGGNEIWNDGNSTITITYSNIQGSWPGEGNIDADPLFVEPGYWDANGVWVDGDYHLLPGSPCIDAGDPNYVAGPNETDLDGRPRVLDGNGDGIPVVDMGAYEYMPSIPAEVRIVPRAINLASKGNWITCYIWLPEQYNVADIDPNSIFLESEIQGEPLYIDEEKHVAISRFSREEVQAILDVGDVELTITGQLKDGTIFEGTDVIRVVNEGRRKN